MDELESFFHGKNLITYNIRETFSDFKRIVVLIEYENKKRSDEYKNPYQ